MLHKRFESESIRKKFMKTRSPKSDCHVRGALAIKAHATRIKVMTNGGNRSDVEALSQKTSSTYHTAIRRRKDDDTESLIHGLDKDQDITGLRKQHKELLDLQKQV